MDIGPEAGAEGGEIVATGTPEDVAKSRLSRTAPFLRDVLKVKRRRSAVIPSRVDGEGPRSRSGSLKHAARSTKIGVRLVPLTV